MSSEPSRHLLRVIEGGAASPRAAHEGVPDRALVASVRAGDAGAASAFHDRLAPVVARTVGRLLGVRDPDYDDVAQQALIELVMGIDGFRAECPLEAWASTVAARAVYKFIRRRRIERRLFVLDSPDGAEAPDRSAGGGALLRSAIRRVEKHLRELDPDKAWAFLLHDVHGYDLEEISAITGASKSAAQSRLVRGRRALHERLGRDPELIQLLSDLRSSTEGG